MRLLVLETRPEVQAMMQSVLHHAGFELYVVENEQALWEHLQAGAIALVVLGFNGVPGISLGLCAGIRARSNVPLIVLASRVAEEDLVAAFEAGADDHVSEPISPRVFIARVRAVLRRCQPMEIRAVDTGSLHLDVLAGTVRFAGAAPVRLTPMEVKALQLLARNAGRTVTTETMMTYLWGRVSARERRTLKQLIYRLRAKLELNAATPQLLLTTPGAGYRLVVD